MANVEPALLDWWVFGYGSLIWKPPPYFDSRLPGYVKGYVRRFWQASEDHRGTPQSPGRVVTLIEKSFWETLEDPQRMTEGDRVWGAAYHIIPEKVAEVQEYLDIREINGYSIQYTPFHPADSTLPDIRCMVYIGMPDNPQFLGALDPRDVAETISRSVGPSGTNKEYLFHLEESLRTLSTDSADQHVQNLAMRVRNLSPQEVLSSPTPEFQRINSNEEMEETEKDG